MEPEIQRTVVAAIVQLTHVVKDHKQAVDDLAEAMRMLEAELEIHRGA